MADEFYVVEDTEADTQVTDAIFKFFGCTVKINTGTPACNTEQLPERIKEGHSKKSFLRQASRLIPFGFAADAARSTSAGKGKDESWEFLDTPAICEHRDSEDWEHVPETHGNDIDAIDSEADDSNRIVVPDSELVQALGSLSFSATEGSLETIFSASDGLVLGDICQNDDRNTCHIHSVAAAYLASPKSASVLRAMFRETGGKYAAVKLTDSVIGDVEVIVSKSRLLSEKKDLYSYSSTGQGGPAMLEKAT